MKPEGAGRPPKILLQIQSVVAGNASDWHQPSPPQYQGVGESFIFGSEINLEVVNDVVVKCDVVEAPIILIPCAGI
jgi:hypothetical protein